MRRPLIFAMFSFLAFAACSSADSGGDSTTSVPAETTTSESGPTDSTEAPAEATTTTLDEQTTSTLGSTGGASCVEGSWLFGAETFVDAMQAGMTDADLAGAEVQPTDGTYTVTFDSNGTFTGVREEWGFAVDTDDGRVMIQMDGTETGTWSADGSTMTVQVDSTDVQVTARVEADGQSFELPSSPVQVPDAIADSSSYQCDSDTLMVTTDDFTFALDRA